jgi:hypothetical protein
MAKERAVFDFDNAGVRTMAKRLIDQARGLWWWELSKCRDQRSKEANGYYWSTVLPHVTAGIREAWGEIDFTDDESHEFLKRRFLEKPVINRNNGEVVGYTEPSTAKLDTAEFGAYLDNVIKFAAEYLNIEIPVALRRSSRAKEKQTAQSN